MLQNTNGIVLRSVRYGETSLICTIFTQTSGVQAYIIQGIRNSKSKQNRAGLFQPSTLLELVVYQNPLQNLHRIKEFRPAYLYTNLQEEIVKNSIALFSIEILLRLLPENAPMPELFDFTFEYFKTMDKLPVNEIANFPLYFLIQCSRLLGYEIRGAYNAESCYIDLQEGAFTNQVPAAAPFLDETDTRILGNMLDIEELSALKSIPLNAETRYRLLDWYLEFLHRHTQHLGSIKSLAVLQAVLH